MCKYIVFDTETTGVPKNNWSDWSECHLIQSAWLVVDIHFNIISTKSFIVKNDNRFNSSEGALKVHHITDEFREKNGITFYEAISHFLNDCKKSNGIICHGALFDIGLLVKESIIYNVDISELSNITVFDTKLSDKYVGMSLNLSDTIKKISPNFVVNVDGIKEHDALYDSYLCLRLFMESTNKDQMIKKFEYFIKRFSK